MIQALITLLCGITCLVCILRQQRLIQLQNEQIQKQEEFLALRDKQLKAYENLHREQAKQIQLLKEYAGLLQEAVRKEPCNL